MKADGGAGEDIEVSTQTMLPLLNSSDVSHMARFEASVAQNAHLSAENKPLL